MLLAEVLGQGAQAQAAREGEEVVTVHPGVSRRPRARNQPRGSKPWFVYYVTWPHMPGVVKIGATAGFQARMTTLREGLSYPHALVAEPGTGDLESDRHEQFAALRIAGPGELFRLEPPLAEHVEALRAALPDWPAMVGGLPWWMNPDVKAATYDEVDECGAVHEFGGPCLLKAGAGTLHRGTGRCSAHEGLPHWSECDHPVRHLSPAMDRCYMCLQDVDPADVKVPGCAHRLPPGTWCGACKAMKS